MVRISTEGLTKTYGRGKKEVVGLRDVSFSIAPGEFVAIVGPSGSGKSTLLLSLGGLIRPSSGAVFVDDTSVYEVDASTRIALRRSHIGFLFQTFNLVPYLTALENVQVPLMVAGMSPVEQRAQATSLLERVGLGERMLHKPAELSIGQQQRVALARALANTPSVILADEPTGNLDPSTAENVMAMFHALHTDGVTLVMVTHDPRMAATASRTLELVDGCICRDSSMSEEIAVAQGHGVMV